MAKEKSDLQVPLTTAFYQQIAEIAWKELDEKQKSTIKDFLVMRFVEEGPGVLDTFTSTQVQRLIGAGCLDEQITAEVKKKFHDLSTKVLELAVRKRIEARVGVEATEFFDKSSKLKQEIDAAVEQIIASGEIVKLASAAAKTWCSQHVPINSDLRETVRSNVCQRLQVAFRGVNWEDLTNGRNEGPI